MAELKRRAERDGVPVARIAAERIPQPPSNHGSSDDIATRLPPIIEDGNLDTDQHAPWIEPVMGDVEWRRRMWGSIVALYGRYPLALAYLKEGWWNNSSHVETLCALVVWRDWIDVAADNSRHELAFQAQLVDFSLLLRQEGGGVTTAWKPGALPVKWTEYEPLRAPRASAYAG